MPVYRVQVQVEGIVRVEAEDADVAQMIAQQAEPSLSGKKVVSAKTTAQTLGEVDNHTLDPQSVRQKLFNRTVN